MSMPFQVWLDQHKEEIQRFIKEGKTNPEIATLLERSEVTIYKAKRALGLSQSSPHKAATNNVVQTLGEIQDAIRAGRSREEVEKAHNLPSGGLDILLSLQQTSFEELRRQYVLDISKADLEALVRTCIPVEVLVRQLNTKRSLLDAKVRQYFGKPTDELRSDPDFIKASVDLQRQAQSLQPTAIPVGSASVTTTGCGTGKPRYRYVEDAQREVERQREEARKSRNPQKIADAARLSTYFCSSCGAWHAGKPRTLEMRVQGQFARASKKYDSSFDELPEYPVENATQEVEFNTRNNGQQIVVARGYTQIETVAERGLKFVIFRPEQLLIEHELRREKDNDRPNREAYMHPPTGLFNIQRELRRDSELFGCYTIIASPLRYRWAPKPSAADMSSGRAPMPKPVAPPPAAIPAAAPAVPAAKPAPLPEGLDWRSLQKVEEHRAKETA